MWIYLRYVLLNWLTPQGSGIKGVTAIDLDKNEIF